MCDSCFSPIAGRLSRRGFLAGACAATIGAGLAAFAPAAMAQQAAPNAISGGDALKRIMEGNARYVANTPNQRDFSARRAALARSQHPIASIVSCADSRIGPELAFDQNPGDLFVVRVAGNFVNDDGLASLEYGAQVLGSPLILVLGHTACGAVTAAIDVARNGTQLPGRLPGLIGAIKPAVDMATRDNPTDLLKATTIANVKLNVEKLRGAAPILSTRAAGGSLVVVGGIYDLATGRVELV